jgi:hypothetical protein
MMQADMLLTKQQTMAKMQQGWGHQLTLQPQ